MSGPEKIILGAGNPILGDDGIGILAAKALSEKLSIPFIECTSSGFELLEKIEGASTVFLCDAVKVDAEEALRHTVEKFTRRFGTVEAELRKRGKSPEETTLGEMDRLWNEAKAGEKNE